MCSKCAALCEGTDCRSKEQLFAAGTLALEVEVDRLKKELLSESQARKKSGEESDTRINVRWTLN